MGFNCGFRPQLWAYPAAKQFAGGLPWSATHGLSGNALMEAAIA